MDGGDLGPAQPSPRGQHDHQPSGLVGFRQGDLEHVVRYRLRPASWYGDRRELGCRVGVDAPVVDCPAKERPERRPGALARLRAPFGPVEDRDEVTERDCPRWRQRFRCPQYVVGPQPDRAWRSAGRSKESLPRGDRFEPLRVHIDPQAATKPNVVRHVLAASTGWRSSTTCASGPRRLAKSRADCSTRNGPNRVGAPSAPTLSTAYILLTCSAASCRLRQ